MVIHLLLSDGVSILNRKSNYSRSSRLTCNCDVLFSFFFNMMNKLKLLALSRNSAAVNLLSVIFGNCATRPDFLVMPKDHTLEIYLL